MRAWIGLGSNIGDGAAAIRAALHALAETRGLTVQRVSGLYRSAPWGRPDQPDFTNAVAELDIAVKPQALLARLLEIETELGRKRDEERWGPRMIDLDLLCVGNIMLDTPELSLPHPRMHERAFVLKPLLEICPGFEIPGRGTARECLDALSPQRVEPMA